MITPGQGLIIVEVAILATAAFWLSRLPSLPGTLALQDTPVQTAMAWLVIAGAFTGFVLLAGSYSTRLAPAMFSASLRPVGLGLIDLALVAILWQRLAMARGRKSRDR